MSMTLEDTVATPTGVVSERVEARICEVSDLRQHHRDAMYALMARYYANTRQAVFERDLKQKSWCLLLMDEKEKIRGFSTQVLIKAEIGGSVGRALFSGDTIVDQTHRGTSALPMAFVRLAVELIARHSGETLYWFLTSKGYRTYRCLPVLFREFYPRRNVSTPRWAEELIRAFAIVRYPCADVLDHGVIPAVHTDYHLRRPLDKISPARLRDPEVQYFQECNPGHAAGDELCCLAPLTNENWSPAALRRLIRKPGYEAIPLHWRPL